MAALLAGILTILLAAPAGSGWSFQWAAADTKQERAKPSGRPGARVPGWIHQRFIAFGPRRKRQMAAYSKRHYGVRQWRLRETQKNVGAGAAASPPRPRIPPAFPPHPPPQVPETPNVCAHFVISGSGRVVQLVPVGIRCRHVVGLNQVAIGIEHTGFSDGDVLGNRRQMRSSIRLTKWLRCRYDIGIRDVIGHRESLGSRFHRELVPSMKYQTHGDFRHSSMSLYRRELHGAGRCIQ